MDRLPLLAAHSPAGTSTAVMAHWYLFSCLLFIYLPNMNIERADAIRHGTFGKYNYGKTKNLEIYGTEEPPQYVSTFVNIGISLIGLFPSPSLSGFQ